jgi:hypothetical protein
MHDTLTLAVVLPEVKTLYNRSSLIVLFYNNTNTFPDLVLTFNTLQDPLSTVTETLTRNNLGFTNATFFVQFINLEEA